MLLLKIVLRILTVCVALAAGLAMGAVYVVFTKGAASLHDHGFIVAATVYSIFVPIASAVIVIPNTIRQHRVGTSDLKLKSGFCEPRDLGSE